MNKATLLASVVAVMTAPLYAANNPPGPAPVPTFKSEKCYGVSRAGGNDCQTMSSSCAGTARRERQADAWVYVPEGVCAKIAGGVVKSKKG